MLSTIITKYYNPTSMTWWISIFALLSGLVLQLSGLVPALQPLGAPLQALWHTIPMNGVEATAGQTIPPFALISFGLLGIGIRQAIGNGLQNLLQSLLAFGTPQTGAAQISTEVLDAISKAAALLNAVTTPDPLVAPTAAQLTAAPKQPPLVLPNN